MSSCSHALSLKTLLKPTDEMMDELYKRKKNMNAKSKEWVHKHHQQSNDWKPFDVVINEKRHTIENVDAAKSS